MICEIGCEASCRIIYWNIIISGIIFGCVVGHIFLLKMLEGEEKMKGDKIGRDTRGE